MPSYFAYAEVICIRWAGRQGIDMYDIFTLLNDRFNERGLANI